MMETIFCELRYHQQDTENFCGLATAQMLIARLRPDTLDQHFLASGRIVSNAGISADVLRDILNDERPEDFGSEFVVFSDHDRETAIRRIVDTLLATRLPVPTLIFGGDPHWVAVTGAIVDGEARVGGDYRLRGFFIVNSAPVTAILLKRNAASRRGILKPPMPHGPDDHCGDGNLQGAKHIYVSAFAWRRHHWPDASPELLNPEFVTITSRRSPPASDIAQTPICTADAPPVAVVPGPVDQESAKGAALAGIAVHGLDRCGPLKDVLVNVHASQADSHENDAPPRDVWFLVTLQDRNGKAVASAFVAADNGELLGVIAPQAPTGTPFEWKTIVLNAIVSEEQNFAELIGSTRLLEDEIYIERPRFWRPCAESMSPYYGFIQARIRGQTLFVAYTGGGHRRLRRSRCTPRPVRELPRINRDDG